MSGSLGGGGSYCGTVSQGCKLNEHILGNSFQLQKMETKRGKQRGNTQGNTKRPVKLPLAPQRQLLLPRVEWRFKSSVAPSVKIVVVSLHMWASISGSVSGGGSGPRIDSIWGHQHLGNSHQLCVKQDLVTSRELLTSRCSVGLGIPDL